MFKRIPLVLALFAAFFAKGQQHFCGQAQVTEHFFKDKPSEKKQFLDLQSRLAQAAKQHGHRPKSTSSEPEYVIPVVFHILHQGGSENISDAQVEDQIRILNRDFQKQNADTAAVVPAFRNLIANVGFGFKLARIDPNGQCTSGIIRHFTPKTNWDANNLGDFIYSWPRDQYLNIYVVKSISIGAGAYTFLPGIPIGPEADVIVCQSQFVGSIGTAGVANSRVITHEVGHWFGLPHIWGTSNQPGVFCGDDDVDDTPITKGFTSCNTNNTRICDPAIQENVQNYMDYAPCKIMFTIGQGERMIEIMTGTVNNRRNLYSEDNLVSAGIAGPNYSCVADVDFRSNGLQNCADRDVQYRPLVQAGSGSVSRLWTFEGGTPATSTDSMPVVRYAAPGTYTVTLAVTTATGTVTETKEDYITIVNGSGGGPTPLSVDFEGTSTIPGLRVENGTPGSVTWEQTNISGANGSSKSFRLNSFSDVGQPGGERDLFELPYMDLTGISNVTLSYYYAYARPIAAQRDSFKIQFSTNCGGSWINIGGVPLTTFMAIASGGITENEFVPQADDWVQVNIPATRLTALNNQSSVKFRFLFVKDLNRTLANNLFIDQIEIRSTTTDLAADLSKTGVEVFPNPTSGSFKVKLPASQSTKWDAHLVDAFGRTTQLPSPVYLDDAWIFDPGSSFNKGIYTLHLKSGQQVLKHRLVVA